MGPVTALMIGSKLMEYQAGVSAAALHNRRAYAQKLAIEKGLKAQYSNARQGVADSNIARIEISDASAEAGVEARLNELRIASSLKASGVPQGQSTKALSRNLEGEALRKESKFLAQLDQKKTELAMRDRNLQQQMDMAWLDAQSQIAGIYSKKGPSVIGTALGVGAAYYKGQAADKQAGNWS